MYLLSSLVSTVVQFYSVLIVVYVFMSWIPQRGGSGWVADIYRVLASVCEPYLQLFRRLIPPIGMIDFSPFVAILVLEVLGSIVVAIL